MDFTLGIQVCICCSEIPFLQKYTLLHWLCKVAGYWRELEHAVVHIDPEHPKLAQWVVTCL